ncbi:MAG TPA: hypothetical protein VKI20_06330 [Acidimicrobiales bacterium]|nr:hypothetical protein [Acidimicrobiales bacterium]
MGENGQRGPVGIIEAGLADLAVQYGELVAQLVRVRSNNRHHSHGSGSTPTTCR